MSVTIRVLSYNIHKGFSSANRELIISRIRDSIEVVHADLVLLQEVVGHHAGHSSKYPDWPTVSQFEYLADRLWPHFAYGKNAVYTEGHHGNAILSKYPISFWENQDVSQNRFERRGLLHCQIEVPGISQPLHAICAHLGLFERDRMLQVHRLRERIGAMVKQGEPLIVGGDFNDWRESVSHELKDSLDLDEAFTIRTGRHPKTYPSWFPIFRLDRLYFRGLDCRSACLAEGSWKDLSDHLPIVAEFAATG